MRNFKVENPFNTAYISYICNSLSKRKQQMDINWYGLLIGVITFLVIGMFHPIVIKAEYYWGTKCWWAFLLIGVAALIASLTIENIIGSTACGVFAFSSFWSIKEIFEQEERVRKGWFPKNPKRTYPNQKGKMACGLIALLMTSPALQAQTSTDQIPTSAERLFYISRSLNKNLVCYDVNLSNGALNEKAPVNVYWYNREDHPGKTNGISFIQERAYGYKVVKAGTSSCQIALIAYPKRELTVSKKNGKFLCTTTISGKSAILQSLYVKASPSNPLKVEYIELKGITTDTSQPVSEKVSK